jgi:membrane protein YdbS with pleckstrin-like domain
VHALDPRVVNLWRLQGFTRLATFWIPVLGMLSLFLRFRYGFGAVGWVALGWILLVALQAVIWPALAYRRYRYAVRNDDLLVESGVLFRHTVSIPLDRIQHVDTRQGPLERIFGLSRVVVYTAAGLSADGSIPGLDEAGADALRDSLVRRRGDDGV